MRGVTGLLIGLLLAAPVTGQPDRLYWVDAGTDVIQRADLEGVNRESVVVFPGGRSGVIPFALDSRAGRLYWIDPATHTLHRARLDGTQPETLIHGGLSDAVDLVVDGPGGRLYWSAGDAIHRAALDGTGAEIFLRFHPDRIGPLALDPVRGQLYWVRTREENAVVDVRVQRANLDGTGVEDVLPAGLLNPTALVVDAVNGWLYWADLGAAGRGTIRRARLDGTNVETLVPETAFIAPWGLALDVPRGRLYWSDNGGSAGAIRRAGLAGGSAVETVISLGLLFPTRLALDVHEGATGREEASVAGPPVPLSAPHPNPFGTTTRFALTPPRTGYVTLDVFDGLGRHVGRLFAGALPAGTARSFTFDAASLPPGLYTIRATGPGYQASRRVVRVR
ncbi:hypothetical protein GQ464_011210 [Rhodocaloribacter litoris]|uniref:hypothetical protein n=1 Tax=Rhodocaloribacter litoris TaxID=2558931 RepID=UPI00142393DA|nr:hypothetical protein [Rhodocaloribacter litoris]QXD14026.1 hypothetical protein GQ464_011210 [Rhodocaloribacter litoris]